MADNRQVRFTRKIYAPDIVFDDFEGSLESKAIEWENKITTIESILPEGLNSENKLVSTESVKDILKDQSLAYDDTELRNSINQLSESITTKVTEEIAKVVADAPEDFDTLKEMSDWISEHKEDASAMNSAILKNSEDIKNHGNYSTEEHVIGEWIDGKTIYRKVFIVETSKERQDFSISLNYNEIVNISGSIAMFDSSNTLVGFYPIGKVDTDYVQFQIYTMITKSYIRIVKGTKNTYPKARITLILEFTKTE